MQYITAIYISRVDIYQRMDAGEGGGGDITGAAVAPPPLPRNCDALRTRDIAHALSRHPFCPSRHGNARTCDLIYRTISFCTIPWIDPARASARFVSVSPATSGLSPAILSQRCNVTKKASRRLISTDCVARSQRGIRKTSERSEREGRGSLKGARNALNYPRRPRHQVLLIVTYGVSEEQCI